MTTVLFEPNHTGEFKVSEAKGYRSRVEAVVASGNDLAAGAVVQEVGGEYVPIVDGGTEPVGVLYAAVDATNEASAGVVFLRDAEVALERLTFPDTFDQAMIDAAVARFEAQGVIVV